jgi:hypothetical protein
MTIDSDGAVLLSPKLFDRAKALLKNGADRVRIAERYQGISGASSKAIPKGVRMTPTPGINLA